jgi:3-hydroxyisobutyrate dehydrogenase-like beta-hydroxyacid dehydrogenase
MEIIKTFDPLFHLIHVVKHCSMMVSFAEGLLLSEKVGLDPNTVVEVALLK